MSSGAIALARAHPLSFTIQYPPRPAYFQQRFRHPLDLARLRELPECLLYLHVPFCEARCRYCNFSVDTRRDRRLQRRYVDGLVRQLDTLRE